ncbi:quinohemoprotein amine dehydrogenase subunit alpha [Cribrihabitans neustonicus]|uniref:quinohemoprotein amine dehydrogenase subunit alpha n=1 Tax=Cribrihabitans neustonicus TaxID=1429085 RepID=UPI003B58D5C4
MRRATGGLAAAILTALASAPAAASEALAADVCAACHTEGEDGGLSRISGQRKTPEGWMMTVWRMQDAHGVELTPEERRSIVQYLSDTQGLTPAETEGLRYALEKDPNAQEAFDEPFSAMCARCHTGARALLQRRTPEEWVLHMDFHVGHFPTIEYQAYGRDREWYRIAKEEIAPYLAETNGLDMEAWQAWQAQEKQPVAGDWVVMTELPGLGEAYGRLSVSGTASPYEVSGEMVTADGTSHAASGSMNFYSGYEWRANLEMAGKTYRQVLAVSGDGNALQGRQFERDNDALGAPLTGLRAGQGAAILGTVPSALPAGAAEVQVVGTGLDALQAGEAAATGNSFGARLAVETRGDGVVEFSAGDARGQVAHYDSIDAIMVEPAFTIARVGGGGGEGPDAVPAHFRAIGFWNGPDGEAGTEDDIRIGAIPARWSVTNAHDHAAEMRDAHFAGDIGADGIFTPAAAGPNPERKFSTNNAGELKVVAEAMGQTAEAMLIVTVQRFIDPPIR